MKKIYVLSLLLLSFLGYSQEYSYIDFGRRGSANETPGNWNNVTSTANNETGITIDLINDNGNPTGVTLAVDDPFDTVNTAGTTSAASTVPFPASATSDSFFGETVAFEGNTQPTGGFVLSNLNPNKFYSFVVFASRMNSTDGKSRQTLYTVTGSTAKSANLEVANNTGEMARGAQP